MSKAKSLFITVLLAVAVAVAAFFAVISFPVENNVKRLNSIASTIHLGSDFSGYAYTTLYPEGVLTAEEYDNLDEEETATGYVRSGSLYVDEEKYPDLDALKAKVESDASVLNVRFGRKNYSSYQVAVEDGVSIKISVPTNFTRSAYKSYDASSRSEDLSVASAALSSMTAYGNLTLRTSDETITLTDSDDVSSTIDMTKKGNDEWVETALVTNSSGSTVKTYSLAYSDDASEYFDGISSRLAGSTPIITFNLSKDGAEKFQELTTRAASSTSQTIYFFVGETQLVSFSCTEAVTSRSISLQANSAETASNSAITLDSAVNGGALSVKYRDIDLIKTSTAVLGENASVFVFAACALVLAGAVVALIVKYKKLGAVTALLSVLFALVELYALSLLSIQVTFAVLFTCIICLALFILGNVIVFEKVRELCSGGRTVQASVKEAYKKVLMTVTDMHVVLVVLAILLAAVAGGEAAACGLIAVVGIVASYVLYWFNRFMWFVTSSLSKDKFGFAGIKRVVYEDD